MRVRFKHAPILADKTIDPLHFAVAALMVQLHKYSSSLSDSIAVRVGCSRREELRLLEINYAISNDAPFLSLCRRVQRDLSGFAGRAAGGEASLQVQWITEGAAEGTQRFEAHISLLAGADHCEARFDRAPEPRFRTLFEHAGKHFKALARNALSAPQTRIGDLSCLDAGEHDDSASCAYGVFDEVIARPELLHSLFRQSAERYRDRIAVIDAASSTTYGGLDRMSSELARELMRRGVRAGDFVGILLDRSLELYVVMLGVLKAGAAYVPIDSDYPPERIRYLLEDSGAKALVSRSELGGQITPIGGLRLDVDRELAAAFAGPFTDGDLPPATDAAAAAYVIYTSGSSGAPKGVVVSHAAVSNLVKAERALYQPSADDRVLQGFSPAFDASIEEIWLALLSGGALVPAAKETMCSGTDLAKLIDDRRVTVLSTVPTLLAMLPPPLRSVRLLILGGESCPQELLTRWGRSGLRIVNTYGPTEATVIATSDEHAPRERITIGRPIPNYAVFVTDGELNPVPRGVPGELCIAAANGVATCYLNREELTAQRFVDAPFPVREGFSKRLYRTGDLGKINEDGKIEFLGRTDSQVKLRGYRIELTEIESQLLELEGVRSAAVAVHPDRHNVPRLVAYVVPKSGSSGFDEERCREALKRRLAPYMVPSLFVVTEALPTLPSGKIDRKRLPKPESSSVAARPAVGPRNSTERTIHGVWKEYFAPRAVSVVDDFFLDLGGHSLLAARVVSELRRRTEFRELSVADVYKHPTIERLARAFRSRQTSAPAPGVRTARDQGAGGAPAPARHLPSRLRHARCGLEQLAGLYLVSGVNLLLTLAGFLVFYLLLHTGRPLAVSIEWAVGSEIAAYPAALALVVGLKWALLGRIRPGRYPLWGWFYARWWLVQRLVGALHLGRLAGSPLLPFALRLLGMRIGAHAHLESAGFAAFDLIEVGSDSSIDEDASLLGYEIADGCLVVAPVTIGSRCFVGARSVVAPAAVMEDDARLGDLSLLPAGTRIPRGESWHGSPARRAESSLRRNPQRRPESGPLRRAATAVLYALLLSVVPLVNSIAYLPGIYLLMQINPLSEPLRYLAALPPVGASFVVLLTIEVALLKWLLVGRVRPGLYPVHGTFYIRHWLVTQLFKMSLDEVGQLHATLHVIPWYRALGAKIGRNVELSTASSAAPDLVELEDGSTVADEVSLGAPHVENGWMRIAPVRLGARAFAGNSSVIPTGSVLGDEALVGVLSIAPELERSRQARATWFGSPPILFPRREPSEGFSNARTYSPPRRLKAARGLFELLRVTLPPAGFLFVYIGVLVGALALLSRVGLGGMIALLPAVWLCAAVTVCFAVALVKWCVIGRYRPFSRPLWSNFVWRLEMVNALYEFLAAPMLIGALRGTPFLPWYLRLLGARIGQGCCFDTTGFLEWDLVEIGDRCTLGEESVVQTHLFEDRILKSSCVRIADDCRVGAHSVILYDTEMGAGSRVEALSLLMKGESIPGGTDWIGCPARYFDRSQEPSLLTG